MFLTVVQTEFEANILSAVRGLKNRRYMCIRCLCDLVNLSSLSQTFSADVNFGDKQVFISLEG